MKKRRSDQEHTVAVSRARAAVSLQHHRPKVEESAKQYKRAKQKRLWQKDQEALRFFYARLSTGRSRMAA